MNTTVLKKLYKYFTYPPQNWERLVYLWKNDFPISFYSWECPPRQIVNDKKNARWVNFDVDIDSVVNGKILDDFTELPRLTTRWRDEKWFIKMAVKGKPKIKYTKLVADTNGLYLYPKSKKILGMKKIKQLSEKFRSSLDKRSKQLLADYSPEIILYTELQKKFKSEYELFFKLVYNNLANPNYYADRNLITYWKNMVRDHIGLTKKDKEERIEVFKRAIASYAAEGMLFQLLSVSGDLPNPVWVNWEETPEASKTTELLRKRFAIEPLPVIYFFQQ